MPALPRALVDASCTSSSRKASRSRLHSENQTWPGAGLQGRGLVREPPAPPIGSRHSPAALVSSPSLAKPADMQQKPNPLSDISPADLNPAPTAGEVAAVCGADRVPRRLGMRRVLNAQQGAHAGYAAAISTSTPRTPPEARKGYGREEETLPNPELHLPCVLHQPHTVLDEIRSARFENPIPRRLREPRFTRKHHDQDPALDEGSLGSRHLRNHKKQAATALASWQTPTALRCAEKDGQPLGARGPLRAIQVRGPATHRRGRDRDQDSRKPRLPGQPRQLYILPATRPRDRHARLHQRPRPHRTRL